MRRTWPVFLLVFTMFAGLTATQGYYGLNALEETTKEADAIHGEYRANAQALNAIQNNLLKSAVLLRDILLNTASTQAGAGHLAQFTAIRADTDQNLLVLTKNLGPYRPDLIAEFSKELSRYWKFLDVIDWNTTYESREAVLADMRGEITPKREAIMQMTDDVAVIARENLNRETQRITESIRQARLDVLSVLVLVVLASIVATGFAVSHVRSLETLSEKEHTELEAAEKELRRLSLELVNAAESQRKSLSLELHDQVGQTLTALKLGISGLDRLEDHSGELYRQRHAELKAMVEECIKTVRHIAMGLRPSMLDDLGLGPALEWLAREFGRQSGLKIDVKCSPEAAALEDEGLRITLYRLAQEALTNTARHSKATHVTIAVEKRGPDILMTVDDDGLGFEPGEARAKGLGLVGMGERVRKYGGSLAIDSRLYVGTRIAVRIPLPKEGRA